MTGQVDRTPDMHQDAGGGKHPIRVLHVAENVKGGIATYLDSVLKFRAAESDPDAVFLLLPAGERSQVDAPERVRVDTYNYSGRGPLSLLRLMWVIWCAIRQIQPDVVHFHSSFPGFAGRLPMLFAKSRVVCIFCAHGWSFEMDMPRWRKVLYSKIERLLSLRTDAVVNISLSDHRAALTAGLAETRCIYIPNGIDIPDAIRGQDLIPEKVGIVNLLFVGRFDHQKGIDLLMDAMTKLQEEPIRLFVVGEPVLGGVELVPADNVEFLGWRSRDQLRGLFTAAHAVVMPSRWEGFGMVAIEAMCCATAVIASDRGALPEVVRDGETGMIFGLEDPHDLVAALSSLAVSRLDEMGKAGQRRYEQYYTARVMNERLEVLYRLLASGKGIDDVRSAIGPIETDSDSRSKPGGDSHCSPPGRDQAAAETESGIS